MQIGEHKELVDFIEKNNGKSIIVTKIHQVKIIVKLIEFYKPSGIQLHFETNPSLILELKNTFPKLIIIGVITNHSTYLDFEKINELNDFLIYDTSYIGGTNEQSSYDLIDNFPTELKNKTLLAGAISFERINKLNLSNIAGFDIQSYFRNNSEYNFRNLDKVCDILKYPRKRKLSIGLTDISLDNIHYVSSFYLNANFDYHIDLSDGSLYTSFNTKYNGIDEKLNFLFQLPFSIHLFMSDNEEIKKIIEKLSNKFPLNLIRIFVQYYDSMDMRLISNSNSNIKIIPTVYYKDLSSFILKSFDFSFISIVVPGYDKKDHIETFFKMFISNIQYFKDKEIWFDRNINFEYIKLIKERLGNNYNYIIGKGIIKEFSKINEINEYLLR